MTLQLQMPASYEGLRPSITVVGIGGAGGNAVNNMIKAKLEGANFVVANTDSQALQYAMAERRIQLGAGVTQGLGAGASPDVGRASAEESIEELESAIRGSNMLFITAGMGGGTGTGAAPVVARLAREMGVLTVGVVTKPFHFEGSHRMRLADQGLEELQKYVDTLIVIPNQNLFRIANEKTTFADAFAMADDVLHSGVRGITDLMTMPGLINLDFADIRAVMSEMGKAMMGTGEAEGDRRAVEAAEAAISNPLLDDVSMKGARGVLINITGGPDLTLFEVDEAANRIREEVDPEANIIFGAIFNENLAGKMRVSVVATGVEADVAMHGNPARHTAPTMRAPTPAQRPAAPRPAATSMAEAKNTAMASGNGMFVAPKPVQPAESSARKVETADLPMAPLMKAAPLQEELEVRPAKEVEKEPRERMEKQEFTPAPAPAAFMPPKPVEPAARSAESPAFRKLSEVKPAETAHAEPAEAPQDKRSMGSSLLQKVGKAFTVKAPDPRLQAHLSQEPVRAVEPTIAASRPDAREEYLDIPAFLRRQAN